MKRKNRYRGMHVSAIAHKEACPHCKKQNTYLCVLKNTWYGGCHDCKKEWKYDKNAERKKRSRSN